MSERSNDSGTGHLPLNSVMPIRTVSSLTGVNPVTLRAWERRYNLLRPTRTAKGHRLYTMADVDLIKQVVTLLDGGMSISQVQSVLQGNGDAVPKPAVAATTKPAPVVATDGTAGEAADETTAETAPNSPNLRFDVWHNYQQRLLHAIHNFDDADLHTIYNEILALYPIDIVTLRVIVPLLHELGWRWQRGDETGVAEEHFFSMFLRNKLGARLHHYNRQQDGPRLVAACLPGEQHDMGLLLFTLVALDWNYRIALLGAATPLPEVALVSQRTACQGIVLAGCYPPEADVIEQQLPQLIQAVNVPVFIGGRVLKPNEQAFQALGLIPLSTDFQQALQTINNSLRNTPAPTPPKSAEQKSRADY